MKLRKLMFVLPNLFTVTSIFCGFYALTLCSGTATPQQLYQAALAIFFATFFDAFDGRVARLTKTQSEFGVQLDSLADVMSFGAAPALLVYKWALAPLGLVGVFISFCFAACGALRLARFNVLASRSPHGGASRFFVGLPIPLAGGMIVSLVIAHYGAHGGALQTSIQVPVAVLTVLLALLMVSTVRYRTFKETRLSARSIGAFVAIIVVGVVIALRFHPAYVLAGYFSLYLFAGLIESVIINGARLVGKKATAGPAPAASEEAEEEGDGEDFL